MSPVIEAPDIYSQAYKRYVTGLLLVVYVMNRADATIFGILMEPIKLDLGLSDTQLGFLAGPAMALCYATLGISVARWADRSHRINIMSVAIAVWSGVVALTATVQTFWQFAFARMGVGVGEAGFSAVAQSVLGDYHSAQERTRALSILMLGIPLGYTLSYSVGGWINQVWGWRTVFIIVGAPGILLALLLKWTVREPPRGQTSATASPESPHPSLRSVLLTLWRRRALRHLLIAMSLLNFVWGVIGWKAPFFMRLHGMSTGELGVWLALVMGGGGVIGTWLSGTLTSRFKVSDERIQARVVAVSATLVCPLLTAALLWSTPAGALWLFMGALIVMSFFFAPSFSLVQGLCPAGMRATMVAIFVFFQILFLSVIGMQLTGVLSDALAASLGPQSLRWAMVALTPVAFWGAVHFWLAGQFIREDLKINNRYDTAAAQAS